MNDWLYPLSSASGRTFIDAAGVEYDRTTLDSFRQMLRGPASNDWWYLATNFRQVQKGDRVWCYYGVADGDVGIVSMATIGRIRHNPDGTHDIFMEWDRKATKRLLATPVPAGEVRRFVPRPRAPVWNLGPHPRLVKELVQRAGM